MPKPRYKTTNWKLQHLAIDATGLKVYGEGEWKVKKTGWMASLESGESCILQSIQVPMKLDSVAKIEPSPKVFRLSE
ncbi:hypothetical protein BCT56_11435 [Vibrio lentus]|uniref:Transposase IS4-like domain-containing protein n=1 Tax=Vibrio lentus TaxID=136468 RepID=A0AB36XQU1_9VIBR|nr:hypothetical protein BCU51_22600 [Vibrio lentus]PMK31804.1 hypothetical protein BCU02_25270 [Vibrio lentus]PMK48727.1 hypothetical protein BCT99_12140 [Vibrio lentus]PML30633.1 hypothetical protein BCT79_20990 [Vibrio lentus]PMM33775.1 hypothetical protein BCT56_11435 [Vibrio lentus]